VFPNADHSMESDVPEAFFSSIEFFLNNQCEKKIAPSEIGLVTNKSPQEWSFWYKNKTLAAGEPDLTVQCVDEGFVKK